MRKKELGYHCKHDQKKKITKLSEFPESDLLLRMTCIPINRREPTSLLKHLRVTPYSGNAGIQPVH